MTKLNGQVYEWILNDWTVMRYILIISIMILKLEIIGWDVVSSFNSKVIWTYDNRRNRWVGYWFDPHYIQKRYGLLKIGEKWWMGYWFDPHSNQNFLELFDWLHCCRSTTVTLVPKLIVDRSLSFGRCRLHINTW